MCALKFVKRVVFVPLALLVIPGPTTVFPKLIVFLGLLLLLLLNAMSTKSGMNVAVNAKRDIAVTLKRGIA